MRIISISNQKGGCGKTTSAISLAACLAHNNKKVLLIDLDPQAHATLGLNIKTGLSVYNVLSKLTQRKAGLKDIIQNVGENFDIAPSNIVLSTLEQELAGEISRESRLWEIMNNFNSDYDYALIDCPPNLGMLTINAIRSADEVIVPVEASRFSLEGVKQLREIIKLISERLNHTVNYRILVINFDSRLRHSFRMLNEIKSKFQNKIFNTIVHVNVKLKEAQNEGTHILSYNKYCRGAKDYFSLSREIITQEKSAQVTPSTLEERMQEALETTLPKLTEVAFSLPAPAAREVHLLGDFNDWKPDGNSKMEALDGRWIKRINLANGRYRYRFMIDGRWTEDPNNPLKEINPYGQTDSLIEVKD